MSDEDQAKLFQPFVQAESSTTRRFGGTGLGLSIVRRLVEMLGGNVSLESAVNSGSTFTVRLPVRLPEDHPAIPKYRDLGGVQCLLVGNDDNAETSAWCEYLEHAGAHAAHYTDFTAVDQELVVARRAGRTFNDIVVLYSGVRDGERAWYERLQPDLKPGLIVVGNGLRAFPRRQNDHTTTVDRDALTRRRLIDAVAVSSGRASRILDEEDFENYPGIYCPPDRATAHQSGQLILVAEDNEVNRKVIRRQLSLLGFAVDVVYDGQQAFEAWQQNAYGVVLTDLHMPNVDGYALTALIRAAETPGQHIPIVALTANALKDEAARCIEHGMDDYLSKPVALDKLKGTLDRWLAQRQTAGSGSDDTEPEAAPVEPPQETTLDLSVLTGLVGDDDDIVREFLGDFEHAAAEIAAQLDGAMAGGDLPEVGALAHRLKSSARAIGALELGERCEALEQAGQTGDANASAVEFGRFERELGQVLKAIRGRLESTTS